MRIKGKISLFTILDHKDGTNTLEVGIKCKKLFGKGNVLRGSMVISDDPESEFMDFANKFELWNDDGTGLKKLKKGTPVTINVNDDGSLTLSPFEE